MACWIGCKCTDEKKRSTTCPFISCCPTTSRGAGRSLPGFGIMLDQKSGSVRKAFYLRAGYLDVIFSVGFFHELSEKYRFCGCLEWRSRRSNSIFVSRQARFGKFSVFGPITIEFSYVNYKGKYSNLHCIFAVIYKGKVNSNCQNTLNFQKSRWRGDFPYFSHFRFWVSTHKNGIFPKVHDQENPGKIKRSSRNASGAQKITLCSFVYYI